MNTADRFWSKVDFSGPEHPSLGRCWLWTAGASEGYGRFYPTHGTHIGAHRWAYEFCVDQIPAGWHVDHLCRNRLCVRPTHLEAVTPRENYRRGLKGALRETCKNGHAVTPENIYVRKDRPGQTECLVCRHERNRAREKELV